MKYPVYSVRDKKVGFGTPYVEQNTASAIRGFRYMLNNSESLMGFAFEDYDLYMIAEFDTEKGILLANKLPEFVISGESVIGDA